jgi:hypothetical protein
MLKEFKLMRNIKVGLVCLLVGFALLFCLRLGYGYLSSSSGGLSSDSQLSESLLTAIRGIGTEFSKSNYASEKLKVAREGSNQELSVDQKYEKIASAVSKTSVFAEDEERIRDVVTAHSALIQFEKFSGLPGSRQLTLAIGVPPARFDPMVAELRNIGELVSIHIDKTDKTNEYKELKAKRISLEKARDSLVALKSKGGRIDEFTNLENRILEIEDEIQSSGVRLGDYDAENEFCTVKLSLTEVATMVTAPTFRQRISAAIAWAMKYYAAFLGLLIIGTVLALLLVALLQRLNVIPPRVQQNPTS